MPAKTGRKLSARNRLNGTVTKIKRGGVVAGVEIKLAGSGDKVYSVVTLEADDDLKLKVGDKVAAIIKSTEVMISKS
jgi:molybdopterin-binding protein